MTLKLAESRSQPAVPYGANLLFTSAYSRLAFFSLSACLLKLMSARERVFTVCQSLASRNDRFMIDSPDVATNDINGHHSNDHQPETRRPLF